MAVNSFFLLIFWLPKIISKRVIAVHARGFQGAACVCRLKRLSKTIRVICDARGVEAEEYESAVQARKGRALNWLEEKWRDRLKEIEKFAVRNSDVVFSVSRAMIEFLKKRAEAPDQRWEYIPCAVEAQEYAPSLAAREHRRRELGWEGRFVVLYAGATQGWQSAHLLPRLFKAIQQREPKAFFLALTPDKENLLRIFEEAGFRRGEYEIMSVEHQRMPDFIACADAGLLLREESPVNAYACPTKFAEYLAGGLHVIATPAVYDIAEFLRKNDVGTLVEDVHEDQRLALEIKGAVEKANRVADRIAASTKAARAAFDWDNYLPTMKKWYLQLLQH